MFKQMENHSFQRDLEHATELTVVTPTEFTTSKESKKNFNKLLNQSSTHIAGPSTSCRGEVCQAVIQKYRPPTLSANPWHKRKTIYLLLIIALLIIWAIIYSTLSQLKIL